MQLNYFVFSRKTAFMPFRDLYGECFPLIDPHEDVSPAQCYYKECPANKGCGEIMAHRTYFLFDKVFPPEVEVLYAYFTYRDRPNSVRAVIFDRSMSEPKTMVLNRVGFFEKCMAEGRVYQWETTTEYDSLGWAERNKIITLDSITSRIKLK